MTEEWKDIIGFEGFYQISNLGNARSVDRWASNHTGKKFWPSRKLRVIPMRHGYPGYILSKNQVHRTRSIHRLLAIHFIPNPENKPEVNHINGIKTDYRLENLEWATRKENMRHAVLTGLQPVGERAKSAKLTLPLVAEIRALKGRMSQRQIAAHYGVKHCTVGMIHRNESWAPTHERLKAEENHKARIGEDHQLAKLDAAKVMQIRQLTSVGVSQRVIAKFFGVSRAAISKVIRGLTWSHVEPCHDKLEALPAEVRREKLFLIEPTSKQKI